MTVSQIASLAATIRNTLGTQNAGVAAGVQNLLGATDNSGGNNGIPAVTDATSLQVEVASLRAASQNIVQAQSLLEAAGGGTTEIEDALNQLQQLSSEASSPDLTDSERVALNNQFQQIKSRIDQIATTAQFGGQKLLDGSLKTAGATDASGNPLAALDDTGLLGSGRTDLLSADDAQQAGQAVANAQKTVQAQQATIQQLQQGAQLRCRHRRIRRPEPGRRRQHARRVRPPRRPV
ncbi:MAG: hypothetical protein WDN72_01840 [Alphaproteobacteria bacterium]